MTLALLPRARLFACYKTCEASCWFSALWTCVFHSSCFRLSSCLDSFLNFPTLTAETLLLVIVCFHLLRPSVAVSASSLILFKQPVLICVWIVTVRCCSMKVPATCLRMDP